MLTEAKLLDAFTRLLQGNISATEYEIPKPIPREGEYRYIPWGAHRFVEAFTEAYNRFDEIHHREPTSFLEIGSGLGYFTQWVANVPRMKARGLEYQESYIELAQARLGKNHRKLYIQGDALAFEKYGDYDLLYFYMPFEAKEKQKKFICRVISQAKGVIFGDLVGTAESPLVRPRDLSRDDIYRDFFVYSAKLGEALR